MGGPVTLALPMARHQPRQRDGELASNFTLTVALDAPPKIIPT
jgi:hypothetical protein